MRHEGTASSHEEDKTIDGLNPPAGAMLMASFFWTDADFEVAQKAACPPALFRTSASLPA